MKSPRTPASSRAARGPQLATLRVRLAEAEETLRAIRSGEVDAVVVAGRQGPQVFTLEGAEHAYRTLIESMNEGALTLTAEAVILYANQCFARMVKCPLEQVTGGSFCRFLSAEEQATLQPLLQQGAQSGAKVQVMLNAGDGSKIPAQVSLRPLARNGADGATIGMVVTDMTEARQIAEQQEKVRRYEQVRVQAAELELRVAERTAQLLKANQELEAFESSVSHDLRGPLHHVMTCSEMLITDYAPQLSDEARTYLDHISASAGKMGRLIQALLEFSRLNKRSLSLQPVDIGRMWHEVLVEMKHEIGDRRIAVTIAELPPCRADPILLRQVLVNLLGNALKYSRTRDCSLIEISTADPSNGESPVYFIKDNGVGFDMKHAGQLFTLFTRLHDARHFEGIGVGLSTAQRIIQRHGGRMWAESAPDAGATFFFTVGPPLSGSAGDTTAGP